jgi:hypothetical protein
MLRMAIADSTYCERVGHTLGGPMMLWRRARRVSKAGLLVYTRAEEHIQGTWAFQCKIKHSVRSTLLTYRSGAAVLFYHLQLFLISYDSR